jgi:hypothetical protein
MKMKEKEKMMTLKRRMAKEVKNIHIERKTHYVLDKFIKNYLGVKDKD